MSAEVRSFTVTVPAGTTAAAPLVANLTMPARIVRHVRVRIPPGPRGVLGWALGAAGVPILPYNAGAWIVGDDETLDWDLEGQISSGAWQVIAYNIGINPHSLYVTFSLDLVQSRGGPPLLSPLDVTA